MIVLLTSLGRLCFLCLTGEGGDGRKARKRRVKVVGLRSLVRGVCSKFNLGCVPLCS